jgi:C_GCAxxG_C_C family probable redox protein
MIDHGQIAKEKFLKGYTCAQAVFCAFCPEMGIDEQTGLALSSSFGGGMGKLRLVCGALSGAFMVLGVLYGDYQPGDNQGKAAHYERVREIGKEFEKRNGSMICAEILAQGAVEAKLGQPPEERSKEYYAKRKGCMDSIVSAAEILDAYLAAHPPVRSPLQKED